ncbi:MAG: agmatine deiminase family protein [Pseudomonadota bacterium]
MAASALGQRSVAQADGFYVPAEEHVHLRTLMQWPVDRQVYRGRNFRDQVQKTIALVANTISEFEPVVMMMSADEVEAAQRWLSEGVEIWDIPTDDLWCRDAGPLFMIDDNGGIAISHIQFNGWGGKQPTRNDNRIAETVAKRLDIRMVETGLVGEGGSTEQSGDGVLIAHESSWVNRNRNPGLSRDQIEDRLLAAYGADRIVWAPGVLGEDITDYHIDSLARFTGPNRVLINLPDAPDLDDPFHRSALETHDILDAEGFEIYVIPEPVRRRVRSYNFVASYSNFYACNGAIIAAEFGDPETDIIAVDALRRHYPKREIVTLNVDVLGKLGGGIHCATQQMPRVL